MTIPRLNRTFTKRRVVKAKKKKEPEEMQSAYDINKKIVEPEDILDLSEDELSEIKTRILKSINPNAPQNLVRYSYEARTYKFEATVEQTAFHFVEDGFLIRKDSEEAKIMKEIQEKAQEQRRLENAQKKEQGNATPSTGAAQHTEDDFSDDELSDEEGANDASLTTTGTDNDSNTLKNQFNFSSRATQTLNNTMVEESVATEPPPTMEFCATATQWEIYDAYVEMLAQQKLNVQKKQSKSKGLSEEDSAPLTQSLISQSIQNDTTGTSDLQVIHSTDMARSVKLMERMINQNQNEELLEDFKFWEDESDTFKPGGMGSLLPLWKFQNEKTRRKHVTGLSWNPTHHDLFAASFGSYNFMKQGTGAVACYSLKNPSYPEYFISTEVGVTAVDFHPKHPSLLSVGLYDGTVSIYDIRVKPIKPLVSSSITNGQHSDVAWQVLWDNDPNAPPKTLSFNSISSDGRVTNWNYVKNELQHTDMIHLKLEDESIQNTQDPLTGLAGGISFSANQKKKNTFVVGTEEGLIHLCSKAYNSQYLNTYRGHHMSVYSVEWNKFNDDLFLSASADWTVKLWQDKKSDPLMTFDLGSSVGEAAWAPYSASVFAAVTDDGRVHVYDLSKNKHDSLCDQVVVKKAKLTHIKFNPSEPIILVGDDKGLLQTLKLSPNLRKETDNLDFIAKDDAIQS
mmetsp:Transcript_10789/g.40337  ORF Transcript_10789/g.40337 Transcript_10789/m.40337 type:complete len:681 (-) Transcript_10789:75-2117(-)|eukprot:CAMPEP_0117450872 /NCGR_PEP_ID=MMETSP0759-20121206/8700_1 /TAXON_ID=63605 /ORGANISM="Percolomonas cosmopolitus, Strain WS" /LENGTH=680 /DNA_ID=CAMNT_0005243423 /DNA_START=284 /DNA_END=2326 /DNA_ORIENTATION=-